MKRSILALSALALACSAALAQTAAPPPVTIYGIVDAGVVHTTGMATNKNQLASGIMEGSRFGLRGNEDIGGGYRAIFTLEHRLELNTGSGSSRPPSGTQTPDRLNQATLLGLPSAYQLAVTNVANSLGQTLGVNLANNFWDRQAYVGLVTPFGAVLAGRQYTPAYEISATFDTLGTQSGLAAGHVASVPASIDIRVSNAVQYRIVLGGLTASAMYAFDSNHSNTNLDRKADRFGGAMVMYKTGRFAVGLGYNQRNNDLGQESLKSTVLGASAQIGPGTLSGLYAKTEDDNPSGVSQIGFGLTAGGVPEAVATQVQGAFTEALKQDGNLMHIGYKMPIGNNTLYVAYTRFDDKRAPDADVASYGVAYSYALSKRTDLNAVLVHFDNKNLAQAAPGGQGYLGGFTASAGKDANSLALGIRHRF